jgi:prephenate dehydrogenase
MIQSRHMNLGIIGFGQFGQFAANHLRGQLSVTVWDLRDLRKRAAAIGATWGTLAEAASKEFVLLAVPMAELPGCLDSIASYLSPGALLMDGCSVKVRPVQWMLEKVPTGTEIIGLHPLFGPQSGRGGVVGMSIVMCPARTQRADVVRQFLEERGLVVHVTSPEQHDRAMAQTQALAQFLSRGLVLSGFEDHELKTPAYERLQRMVEMLRPDSKELFEDMHRLNPFATEERRKLLESLLKIHRELESLPRDA